MAKISAFERSQQEIDQFAQALDTLYNVNYTKYKSAAFHAGFLQSALVRAFAQLPKSAREAFQQDVMDMLERNTEAA